jgi:hypothetical protein
MTARFLTLVALSATLLGCSDWGPEPATLIIEPVETFFQPHVTMGGGLEDYPYDVRTEIDVVVRNLSDTTVYLDRCLPTDTLPVFGLRHNDGSLSTLHEPRVCISAPAFEIAPGESRSMRLIAHTNFLCGANFFCDLWKPDTWGYHRVVLSADGSNVASRRFYLQSPFIFD